MDIANITFSYERIHAMLTAWSSLYEVQIIKDHQRFYDPSYGMQEFYEEVSQVDRFFENRFSFAMKELAETFDLAGTLTSVRISTNAPEGWQGYYYSDFPVSVSVHPEKGWHFAGWQGDASGMEESLTISLENGDVSLRAIFERD